MSRVSLGCWSAAVAVLFLGCKSAGEVSPEPPSPAPASAPVPVATVEQPSVPVECQKDSDCALTQVPEGGCCPQLCTPRAVPAAEATALEQAVQRCEREGRPCALPSCRAAMAFEVGCAEGKCARRRMDDR